MSERRLAGFGAFKPTMSYETLTGVFEMDSVHQMMRFLPSSGMDALHLHYSDILDADTVMTDSATAGLVPEEGENAVSGEKPYISEFYLHILLADPKRSNVRIPFIFQRTLKDSVLGRRAVEDSYVIKRWVRGAMKEQPVDTAYATEEELREEEAARKDKDSLVWTCPRCSYINLGMRSMCMNCGISRSDAVRSEGGTADAFLGRTLARISLFEPSKSCETLTGLFEADTVHQMVRFTPNNGGKPVYAHYRDILDVEAVQKTSVISDENAFDEKEQEYFTEYYLYIMLNLRNKASIEIPFIFQRTLRDSVLGRRAVSDCNTVKRWLRDAMHEPARETAFADEEQLKELSEAEKDVYGWDCPKCGYRNRNSRLQCVLCGHDTLEQ